MSYITTYKEYRSIYTPTLRSYARSFALDIFSLVKDVNDISNSLEKNRVQFLYIHHIFNDELAQLEKLIKALAKKHHFISYTEAVNKILTRSIDAPYICISSDDGFKNNLQAAELLNKYGISACFFVNPSLIGESSFEKIEEHCRKKLNFPPVDFLNWIDIEKLQTLGHEIGSHTMYHNNVTQMNANSFMEDCLHTKNILEEKCGSAKHFAFPYGRFSDFNEVSRKIVFDAGYISCATAERGCHINHNKEITTQELCIRRDHIILDWKLNHIFYFLIDNSKKANIRNNLFPY